LIIFTAKLIDEQRKDLTEVFCRSNNALDKLHIDSAIFTLEIYRLITHVGESGELFLYALKQLRKHPAKIKRLNYQVNTFCL